MGEQRVSAHLVDRLANTALFRRVDSTLTTLGWWEWAALPGLTDQPLRAKCDTGAAISALHAENLEVIARGERTVVRFSLNPEAEPVELAISTSRQVKSSNGESQNRPVVLLPIEVAGHLYAIECTLTDRTPMAYPMLLGRSALAGRFVVDPSRSRLHRKPRTRRRK